MDTAVIIAGGEGTRLRPLTDGIPKTLVEVAGKPMLQWTIEWLKAGGIKHLVIGVAYKKEKIYEFMKAHNNFGMDVHFSEHSLEGGTAEGFRLAIERHVKDRDFIAMNSDELTNMDLRKLIEKHKKHSPTVTMAISPFYVGVSIIDRDKEDKITSFEYGRLVHSLPVSIGIYAFNSGIIDYIPKSGSIENTAFKQLVKEGKARAMMLSDGEEWVTVNTPHDITKAEQKLKEWGGI